jgi:hypothetical protein
MVRDCLLRSQRPDAGLTVNLTLIARSSAANG